MADKSKTEVKKQVEHKDEAKVEHKDEAKVEGKKVKDKEEVKVTGKMAEFVDWIENISVLDLSKLVKVLEKRLGVSANAPAVAVSAAAGAGAAGAAAKEEQTEFKVILKEIGDKKIQVIKEVRSITELGLKDSKDLVESAPKAIIRDSVSKEEAEKLKQKLETVGAKVEIK